MTFEVVACLMIDHLNTVRSTNHSGRCDSYWIWITHSAMFIESCVSQFDLPTVLFTKNSRLDTIRSAIDAGVTAYIVDGIDPVRLDSILEISIEQYKKHKKLLNDLAETKCKLADRKDIEKAKVMLMQIHGINRRSSI